MIYTHRYKTYHNGKPRYVTQDVDLSRVLFYSFYRSNPDLKERYRKDIETIKSDITTLEKLSLDFYQSREYIREAKKKLNETISLHQSCLDNPTISYQQIILYNPEEDEYGYRYQVELYCNDEVHRDQVIQEILEMKENLSYI